MCEREKVRGWGKKRTVGGKRDEKEEGWGEAERERETERRWQEIQSGSMIERRKAQLRD